MAKEEGQKADRWDEWIQNAKKREKDDGPLCKIIRRGGTDKGDNVIFNKF